MNSNTDRQPKINPSLGDKPNGHNHDAHLSLNPEPIDLLLKALEHPECFSDAELETILSHPEAREFYAIISKTTGSLAETPVVDINREWQSFEAAHLLPIESAADQIATRQRARRVPAFLSRHAAAVVGLIILASVTIIAATIGLRNASERTIPSPVAASDNSMPRNDNLPAFTDTVPDNLLSAVKPEIITFKEETLESIINAICGYYGASASFASEPKKHLQLYYKWDQSIPLQEVIDELNSFEQISINLSDSILYIK